MGFIIFGKRVTFFANDTFSGLLKIIFFNLKISFMSDSVAQTIQTSFYQREPESNEEEIIINITSTDLVEGEEKKVEMSLLYLVDGNSQVINYFKVY